MAEYLRNKASVKKMFQAKIMKLQVYRIVILYFDFELFYENCVKIL